MPMTAQELQTLIRDAVRGEMDAATAEIASRFTPGLGDGSDPKAPEPAPTPTFKSLGEQLQAVAREKTLGVKDPRLKATGLSEEVPADGGYLVEHEFVNDLLERAHQTGVLPGRCAHQPVGPGFSGVKIPAVNETSRADGSRSGGIRAYWASEGGTKTASAPKFRIMDLGLDKLIGLIYVTDELLQDAMALGGYIQREFPKEFGFKMDDALVNGDGAGKPQGIMSSPCKVDVAKETGQAAATIVTENIDKMWARLWAASMPNAIWLINQDCLPELMKMSIAIGTGGVLSGRYVPPGFPGNAQAGSGYGTMYGRPVIPIEQCQTLGTSGDILLVDMSQYLLADKGGIQAASSIHVQFTTDETAFRFVYRVTGQGLWNSALTPFKGANTVSPFLSLATRS